MSLTLLTVAFVSFFCVIFLALIVVCGVVGAHPFPFIAVDVVVVALIPPLFSSFMVFMFFCSPDPTVVVVGSSSKLVD